MAKLAIHHKKQIFPFQRDEILRDYRTAYLSRAASLLGRKEVLTGKAKFGIFGDGKEVAQMALSRCFQPGDWRSGYYRDQTLMFALECVTIKQFFAQLYADTDLNREPCSAGRQMNSHFSMRYIDHDGNWLNQTEQFNTASDISPTAGQMVRALGLAYASKLYRHIPELQAARQFSKNGNEVVFATIGNASTSEGPFWETLNAAGVLQVPLVVLVWDDDYGISVPSSFHTVKQSISKALAGFQKNGNSNGIDIVEAKGWDYANLRTLMAKVTDRARSDHRSALIHVTEMTQPQGHSTSGSHERYKSKERLEYERSMDCLLQMRQWMIEVGVCSASAIDDMETQAQIDVEQAKVEAWDEFQQSFVEIKTQFDNHLQACMKQSNFADDLRDLAEKLDRNPLVLRRHLAVTGRRARIIMRHEGHQAKSDFDFWLKDFQKASQSLYSSHLLSQSKRSPLNVSHVAVKYADDAVAVDGRMVIQKFFDRYLERDPRCFLIGEDIGQLGGVNLEFEGLAAKHTDLRVTDTSIREATILGQGIGAAMRGLRPIVDIQYLDYLLYCLQPMSDDLATLHYRSAGGQIAPVIIRTKGHRLEGIWHTGSPMGMILSSVRGLHVCVPRNMTQAAGLYNTLLQGDDPALVIEVLNGYRLKEKLPQNLGEYTVPLGMPEVIKSGKDITIVTYGACVRLAQEALELLATVGIDAELIDVQTLLPFDSFGVITDSIKKTHGVLFVDEDVPGGASAYMMQKTLEESDAFSWLDSEPKTCTAQQHRSPYGSDGDYFAKPNVEDIFETAYLIMRERNPTRYPEIFSSKE